MVESRPPLAGLVWLAFYVPGVARRAAALHPGLLFQWRLRRPTWMNKLQLRFRRSIQKYKLQWQLDPALTVL